MYVPPFRIQYHIFCIRMLVRIIYNSFDSPHIYEDTQLVMRAIGVSHTACKDECIFIFYNILRIYYKK